MFPDEASCWRYLVKQRWPNGFICPKCGATSRNFLEERLLFVCLNGHQTSVTADTVMHRTHMSLRHWFWAAWLQVTQTPGISSVVLSRQLGVKQESAFQLLHRLRAGMVNPERAKLHGMIEVDETYISAGRVRRTRQSKIMGRGTLKPLVIAAVEVRGDHSGRVRLRQINKASDQNVLKFLDDHVEQGSIIVSDGWQAYRNVKHYGYRHHVVLGDTPKEIATNLPNIHRVFSNLKAWLIGTHHGVSAKHLQSYLNEFTFRYNRRSSPMQAFAAILGISSRVAGPEYEELYDSPHRWVHANPQTETIENEQRNNED